MIPMVPSNFPLGLNLCPALLKNIGGETIPPYSLVEIVSSDTSKDNNPDWMMPAVYNVQQYTGGNSPLASTGAAAIDSDDTGPGIIGPLLICKVRDASNGVTYKAAAESGEWSAIADDQGKLVVIKVSLDACLVMVTESSPGEASKLKFITTDDIANRSVSGIVTYQIGTEVSAGDAITLRDPHNLWPNITPACVGTAFYNPIFSGWEIETCSLPANELLVELIDPLLRTDTTGVARVPVPALRSTYPNVMPPDLGCGTGAYKWNDTPHNAWQVYSECPAGCELPPPPENPPLNPSDEPVIEVPCYPDEPEIEFQNVLGLEGICDSQAIIRRVTDAGFGDAFATGPTGSSENFQWELIHVVHRKARWIKFVYDGSTTVEPNDWYDGANPTLCDATVTVAFPLGEPCSGDEVIAFYNPDTDVYISISTVSATLGVPFLVDLVHDVGKDDENCGVKLTMNSVLVFATKVADECVIPETTKDVELGESVPVVVSVAADACGRINYAYQNIRAFLCESEIQYASFALNLGDALFVTGAYFDGCDLVLEMNTLGLICWDGEGTHPGGYSTIVATMGTEELIVSGEIFDNGTALEIERWSIRVCSFEAEPEDLIPILPCPTGSGGP